MTAALQQMIGTARGGLDRYLCDGERRVALRDIVDGTSLGEDVARLRGRSVLLATRGQLATALALVELDGLARRVILCPPDLSTAMLASIMMRAAVDAVVSDLPRPVFPGTAGTRFVPCRPGIDPSPARLARTQTTEWILLTSGTAGAAKLVVHKLATLAGAIVPGSAAEGTVWSTFYDIRRYGGMQILLRALIGGGSLILRSHDEALDGFLTRVAAAGTTHMSGTPSHWRRALMCLTARKIAPRYVRLSGEIADQAILDALHGFFPGAAIVHAFASTEAGLAFEIADRLAGFPGGLVGSRSGAVEIRIKDGSLRIRSTRMALRYLGGVDQLADEDGFVDTGDVVERTAERYHFAGRRGGIINVGGLKIHPEEVEAVINTHPGVEMSLVRGRRSSLTGSLVVAEIVARSAAHQQSGAAPSPGLRDEIMAACRSALAPHKVPAAIRFVTALEIAPSGKLVRSNA